MDNISVGLIIDALLVLIALVITARYTSKGFAGSVFSLFGFTATIILSVAFTDEVSVLFYDALSGKTALFPQNTVAKVFAFTLIFLSIMIVIRIFAYVLSRVVRLVPIINTLDKLGGFFLGILSSLIWVQILSIIITVFGGLLIEYFFPENTQMLSESRITGFFYEFNFFKRIFEYIG